MAGIAAIFGVFRLVPGLLPLIFGNFYLVTGDTERGPIQNVVVEYPQREEKTNGPGTQNNEMRFSLLKKLFQKFLDLHNGPLSTSRLRYKMVADRWSPGHGPILLPNLDKVMIIVFFIQRQVHIHKGNIRIFSRDVF
jgi:hypothetical protein